MKCPKCGSGKLIARQSFNVNTMVVRKRVCSNCDHKHYTIERLSEDQVEAQSIFDQIILNRARLNECGTDTSSN